MITYQLKQIHQILKRISQKKERQIIKKLINIFGANGVGKSIITILLANIIAENNLKVLIIDYTQNIYTIFNKKPERDAIKIESIYLSNKFYRGESDKYNIVIFDNPQISFLKKKELLNNSTNIFLSESNLLGIKKLSKLIGITTKDIRKENINIIFNKYNSNSLDKEILYNIFKSIKILGKIDYSKKIDTILNMERIININSIRKDLLKIRDNLLKENKVYGDRHTK